MHRPAPTTSIWLADHLRALGNLARNTIPMIDPAANPPILPGIDLWDLWPLQQADGSTALFEGTGLWFVLCAPALPDPEARHDQVRIRLMSRTATGQWRDHGHALPDGFNPGSREWAGSALFHPEAGEVTLFYTVAGYRGEAKPSYAQRLFQTRGRLSITPEAITITGWTGPDESFTSDDQAYMLVNQRDGSPGAIKGFRDPAHFRDPATGERYITFTGSIKPTSSTHNGCIGIARATDASLAEWELLPPLISADGLNNEMERPLLIARDGLYYLFWSTQRKVFAPDAPSGPNGVYGMVADDVLGPWRPLNGSGLVAANPENAPFQAYSWWVDADLTVWGFIDYPACTEATKQDDPAWRRACFGGTPAPTFRLVLEGDKAWIA